MAANSYVSATEGNAVSHVLDPWSMMVTVLGVSWADRCYHAGHVLRLTGTSGRTLIETIDDLPATAPLVLACHLRNDADGGRFAAMILDELRRIVVALFPAWLPGEHEANPGRTSLDLAGALAVARRLARTSTVFGPFVADVVRSAFDETPSAGTFAPEVAVAGLTRLLNASYLRRELAILVVPESEPDTTHHSSLAHACEWLATQAPMCVWLTDDALATVDRYRSELATPITSNFLEAQSLHALQGEPTSEPAPPPTIEAPIVEGKPAPHSVAEQLLERNLRAHDWADGRAWNTTTPTGSSLHPTIRPDLTWSEAHLIVEIDGVDHRSAAKYAADRTRDNLLQRSGYLVLRYTNDQVLSDIGLVLAELQDVVTMRHPARASDHQRRMTR